MGPALARGQEKPFVVQGTIRGGDGKEVTLINVENNKKLDGYLVRNEAFLLHGSATPGSVFALSLDGASYPLLFVSDGGDSLAVTASADQFPLATLRGNAQSLAMQQYQQEFSPLMKQAQGINSRAMTLSESDTAARAALQNEANAFNAQMQQVGTAFIRYHPSSLASVFVLMNEMQNIPPQQLLDLYRGLDDTVRNSKYGQMTAASIQTMAATAVGADAPGFSLQDAQGNQVSLASFRGKYVLIDFWASWCGPCRAENPNVVKAYRKYKDRNFTVLGVSLDESRQNWLNAIRQDGLDWTQVSDLGGWNNAAAQLYHVSSIPANFLVDPSGKIVAKELRGPELEKTLASLLQ